MRKERLGVSQENTVGWETHDKTLKRLRGIVVTSREISFVTYHKNRPHMRCVIDSTLNTAYTMVCDRQHLKYRLYSGT